MKRILIPILLGFTSLALAEGYGHEHHDERHKKPKQMQHHQGSHDEDGHHGEGHHSGGNHGSDKHGKGHHANEKKAKGHQKNHHDSMEQHGHGSAVGKPGKASKVSRTIEVEATDEMRFKFEPFAVKAGETIRFLVKNSGQITHEFSLGTPTEHQAHGKMMMANPDMHHGPGGASITIKPGESGELIWKFSKAKNIEIACNIPGHYQAGMHHSLGQAK